MANGDICDVILLDTEGFLSGQDNDLTDSHQFAVGITAFLLSTSDVCLFNVKGEPGQELLSVLQMAVQTLKQLDKGELIPKIVFLQKDEGTDKKEVVDVYQNKVRTTLQEVFGNEDEKGDVQEFMKKFVYMSIASPFKEGNLFQELYSEKVFQIRDLILDAPSHTRSILDFVTQAKTGWRIIHRYGNRFGLFHSIKHQIELEEAKKVVRVIFQNMLTVIGAQLDTLGRGSLDEEEKKFRDIVSQAEVNCIEEVDKQLASKSQVVRNSGKEWVSSFFTSYQSGELVKLKQRNSESVVQQVERQCTQDVFELFKNNKDELKVNNEAMMASEVSRRFQNFWNQKVDGISRVMNSAYLSRSYDVHVVMQELQRSTFSMNDDVRYSILNVIDFKLDYDADESESRFYKIPKTLPRKFLDIFGREEKKGDPFYSPFMNDLLKKVEVVCREQHPLRFEHAAIEDILSEFRKTMQRIRSRCTELGYELELNGAVLFSFAMQRVAISIAGCYDENVRQSKLGIEKKIGEIKERLNETFKQCFFAGSEVDRRAIQVRLDITASFEAAITQAFNSSLKPALDRVALDVRTQYQASGGGAETQELVFTNPGKYIKDYMNNAGDVIEKHVEGILFDRIDGVYERGKAAGFTTFSRAAKRDGTLLEKEKRDLDDKQLDLLRGRCLEIAREVGAKYTEPVVMQRFAVMLRNFKNGCWTVEYRDDVRGCQYQCPLCRIKCSQEKNHPGKHNSKYHMFPSFTNAFYTGTKNPVCMMCNYTKSGNDDVGWISGDTRYPTLKDLLTSDSYKVNPWEINISNDKTRLEKVKQAWFVYREELKRIHGQDFRNWDFEDDI
eukprot:TRINITY_DN20253_c1_g1_i1.p1 TRINITY_DN20253_c1_g1~~TRINITY_DN20253_c1_g1_i1.p1  ORF type:complete len:869 (-),score=233.52 TRINITY_DN20253_c1_g1_i1:32-2545(-)